MGDENDHQTSGAKREAPVTEASQADVEDAIEAIEDGDHILVGS